MVDIKPQFYGALDAVVTRIVNADRPHALTVSVQLKSNQSGNAVGEPIRITISASLDESGYYAIANALRVRGYDVVKVRGFDRQLARYNKLLAQACR